jgi:hypothetical protein
MFKLEDCLTPETRVLVLYHKEKSIFKSRMGKIYRKDFNHAEFVGQELCDMRNIPTARYTVIGESFRRLEGYMRYSDLNPRLYNFRIGSYDFKRDDSSYFTLTREQLNQGESLSVLLSMCPTKENQKQVLNELQELIALDTYMGQTDRTESNIIFSRNKKTLEMHLAPIFDYEYSLKRQYLSPYNIYENPITRFDTVDDYKYFMEKYPELREKLKFYLDVDLKDTVRRAYASRQLIIPKDNYQFIEEFDEERKELIHKIIR